MPENVRVFTETICEACMAIKRRDGNNWDTLPEGWASLLVVVYGLPEEPYDIYRRIEKTVCPSCLLALESFFPKSRHIDA